MNKQAEYDRIARDNAMYAARKMKAMGVAREYIVQAVRLARACNRALLAR